MLLLNTTYLKSVIINCVFSIFIIFATSAHVIAQDPHEIKNDITKTLRAFNYSESESTTFGKLDTFLQNNYGYTNREYLDALTELGVDFAESVKEINTCIETATDSKKIIHRSG